ncbi:hypothetical protein Hypma_014871 [Hypsizygus marmoreus]|uniref:RNA-directed DNA polymerase n=1 Tax=Hypsizygus marmoreus TaxID=39966 RepID=A0A369K5U7_HYPMA|nr:hypothetical protein Hypma_014871 [Hypsizygus marmoreus]
MAADLAALPQAFNMRVPMPTPGTQTAPTFAGRRVSDFLDSLEQCADQAGVAHTVLPTYVPVTADVAFVVSSNIRLFGGIPESLRKRIRKRFPAANQTQDTVPTIALQLGWLRAESTKKTSTSNRRRGRGRGNWLDDSDSEEDVELPKIPKKKAFRLRTLSERLEVVEDSAKRQELRESLHTKSAVRRSPGFRSLPNLPTNQKYLCASHGTASKVDTVGRTYITLADTTTLYPSDSTLSSLPDLSDVHIPFHPKPIVSNQLKSRIPIRSRSVSPDKGKTTTLDKTKPDDQTSTLRSPGKTRLSSLAQINKRKFPPAPPKARSKKPDFGFITPKPIAEFTTSSFRAGGIFGRSSQSPIDSLFGFKRTTSMAKTHTSTGEVPEDIQQIPDNPIDPEVTKESSIEELWNQFNAEDEEIGSTATRVQMYSNKMTLEIQDIEDRGNHLNRYVPRFAIVNRLLQPLDITVTQLQFFLDKLSELSSRKTTFKVDPFEMFIHSLKGASSVDELHAAWVGLQKRIVLSIRNIKKYESEVRDSDILNSPTSTNPDLYNPLEFTRGPQARLNYILGTVPHHREDFTDSVANAMRDTKEDKVALPAPSLLLRSFPERPWERDPRVVRYSSRGNRMEVLPDDWRESQGLPKRETSEERRSKRPKEPERKDVPPEPPLNRGYDLPHDPSHPAGPSIQTFSPMMGPKVSFKASTDFFDDTKKGHRDPPPHQKEEHANVLFGAATPSSRRKDHNPSDWDWYHNGKGKHKGKGRADGRDWRVQDERTDRPSYDRESTNERNRRSEDEAPHKDKKRDPDKKPFLPGGRHDKDMNEDKRSYSDHRKAFEPEPDPDPSSSDDNSSDSENHHRRHDSQPKRQHRRSNDRQNGSDSSARDAPYGSVIPTIKADLKTDDLPTWDGKSYSAVQYFSDIQELAEMGGHLPEALGYWLWTKLKPNSDVRRWFTLLDHKTKTWAKSHYRNYLTTIKDSYLGRSWQLDINHEFNSQSFRQQGHEYESPRGFIQRRILYTRMLATADDGGPEEVRIAMLRAPLSWHSIIQASSIQRTVDLYSTISNNEKALIQASRVTAANVVTTDNLVSMLRRVGVNVDQSKRPAPPQGSRPNTFTPSKTAHAIDHSSEDVVEIPTPDELPKKLETIDEYEGGDALLSNVYQTFTKRQRDPPPDGYPFPKNDHVTTKLSRLPPSPCKVCGSEKHWDKECPDWDTYLSSQKRSAKWVTATDEHNDLDVQYSSAYGVLRDFRVTKALQMLGTSSNNPSGFESAAPGPPSQENEDQECKTDTGALARAKPLQAHQEHNSQSQFSAKLYPNPRKATIEEIDDEYWANEGRMPTARVHIIESDDDSELYETISGSAPDEPSNALNDEDEPSHAFNSERRFTLPKHDFKRYPETYENWIPNPDGPIIHLPKKRVTALGRSALGMSVLSMKGWVGSLYNQRVDLRLDSGADITLISEDFYKSLKSPPPIQRGMRLKLWQLTDTDTAIQGFVRIPIIVEDNKGRLLESEAEAYVVPNMTVPILLGEDYQVTYEVCALRDALEGTTVEYGRNGPSVNAEPVVSTHSDFSRLRQSAYLTANFVRSKSHRRNQAKRMRHKRSIFKESRTVRAANDCLIQPNECRNVEVIGDFDDEREWLIEKNLLPGSGNDFFAVPNVLVSGKHPRVPISNTSPHPRYVRRGEIVGSLTDPKTFFDTPRDLKTLETFHTKTAFLSSIITARMDADDSAQAPSKPAPSEQRDEPHEREQDEYGPKTAAMPDPEIYPSTEMEQLLDVGSLPDHLKRKAWDMLRRRQRAFSFDGRLGQHPARVHIRTVDGQQPIAVPMYGSSPAKRLIINEQLDKWFEQAVIEPSISPWSAPVVIAYRNGKPRFCVDYRKLNAVTIPDEFPIPRQSEILSSLSGAQVLSSLDALAGFTQLEMDPDDVEKTAFRTHRGLFQFRRMPFGLRNGPSIFQRVMQSILSPYLWLFCLVYIDDIVVYSKSYEDHIEHLDKVLKAVEDAGLTLSPKKCHLFYSSILLLGHRVSRLGLSTHLEKVSAILDLARPQKLSQLQSFLGMVVYFSSFIPHYASICAPLFQLLRKGYRWKWGAEQEHAFKSAKDALREAPVLGHPIEGRPYRLYTDASDEALGCCLQQIQPIAVRDLKGTRTYTRLDKAFREGKPIPKLTTTLSDTINDSPSDDKWGPTLDDTVVHVERVIAYWSRMFKGAEQRYATTEREALAAKEGLVKFQPFVEGEKITLITDHSALQWARTYENSNRRLAAWGSVFAAYPGLVIVHRAGRVHSNVDPLSRLPRAPPPHTSPEILNEPVIQASDGWRQIQEEVFNKDPARHATFVAWDLHDCLEGTASSWATTRASSLNDKPNKDNLTPAPEDVTPIDQHGDTLPQPPGYAEMFDSPAVAPHIHVHLDPDVSRRFQDGYLADAHLKKRWESAKKDREHYIPGSRYFVDDRDLLFFRDADFQPRLCVPRSLQDGILSEAHENAYETAHTGPEKLWQRLKPKFYWHRMKKDILRFCATCDVCQKTKGSNFRKFGTLIPNPIPTVPYQSVSMDFIVNLPWSDEYNAIFVVVDRFTKYAQFIPTTTGLTAQDFGALFTRHVGCKYGLPETIITDRDPRWTADFWRAVAAAVGTKMSLSSSHHPQHDGQTEIVNKQIETMLRAYIGNDKSSWSAWIHVLEYAYNSAIHSSTGMTPFFLLHGFEPRKPLDFITTPNTKANGNLPDHPEAKDFLLSLETHRESARQAIAKAQERQVRTYNKGRKPARQFAIGSQVLVNPHTLEWTESKGDGSKLVQRWIGPFEVLQRINPNVYRLRMSDKYTGSPVFNIAHLKPYAQAAPTDIDRAVLPETRVDKAASEEYDVEKIVGHKFDRKSKKIQYLVRWSGYGPQFDTWQSPKDMKNAPWIVASYRKHAKV